MFELSLQQLEIRDIKREITKFFCQGRGQICNKKVIYKVWDQTKPPTHIGTFPK